MSTADYSTTEDSLTLQAWAHLMPVGEVHEFRALNARLSPTFTSTVCGYFDSPEKMMTEAKKVKAPGYYYTLNPCKPALLARCANRTERTKKGDSTSAGDILRRLWLMVDCDAEREGGVSGIPATDDERAAAHALADRVEAYLRAAEWPDPIRVDSGNGSYCLYRIDLPTDDGGLVQRVLQALAGEVKSDRAGVDASVHDAGRLIRIPDTPNRKGDEIPGRPHRWCRVLSCPAVMEIVPREKLEALAALAPAPAPKVPTRPASTTTGGSSYDSRIIVPQYLSHYGIDVLSESSSQGIHRWRITCPFDPSHTGTDAYVGQADSGAVMFHCSHNSCSGNKWEQLKQAVGKPLPDHYDPPRGQRQEQDRTEVSVAQCHTVTTSPAGTHKYAVGDQVSPVDRGNVGTVTELLSNLRYRVKFVGKDGVAEKVFPERSLAPLKSGGSVGNVTTSPPRPVPEYVPFPVHCLPGRVQEYCQTVAAATNTDPVFTALPLLTVMGAAVGTSRAASPKRGWNICPTFWGAGIAESGRGKSPPLNAINEAVHAVVDDLDALNRRDREEWEIAATAAKKAKGTPPPEPPRRRFRVGDITIEALAFVLSQNPRGVWLCADELAGWFGSFTRYSSGKGNTDRSQWLTLFDAGSLDNDRKTGDTKTMSVRNAMVCVYGGIQPKILKAALTEENVGSGLFARLLMAYPPDRLVQWTDNELPESATQSLTALLRALRDYQPDESDLRPRPRINTLSPDAKKVFVDYFNRSRSVAFTADGGEAAFAAKLEAYAVRFAHIRHLCRYAGGDDSDPISAEDMAAGVELAEWFRGEYLRIQALLGQPDRMAAARRLHAWVVRQGGRVTPRQLQRHDQRRYRSGQDARDALGQLVKDGLGRWETTTAKNGKQVEHFVASDPGDSVTVCDTAPDDAEDMCDTVCDTAPDDSTQVLAGQGKSKTVSHTVTLSPGLPSQREPDAASGSVSHAVSHTPGDDTPPLPARYYQPQTPPAATQPPARPEWMDRVLQHLDTTQQWVSTPDLVAIAGQPADTVVRYLDARHADGEIDRRTSDMDDGPPRREWRSVGATDPEPVAAPTPAPATITTADDLARAIKDAGMTWDAVRDAVDVYTPEDIRHTTVPERSAVAAYLASR